MLHYRPPIRGIVLYLYTLIVFWLWQSLVAVATILFNLRSCIFLPSNLFDGLASCISRSLEPPYKKRIGEADATFITRCRRQLDWPGSFDNNKITGKQYNW